MMSERLACSSTSRPSVFEPLSDLSAGGAVAEGPLIAVIENAGRGVGDVPFHARQLLPTPELNSSREEYDSFVLVIGK